MGSFRTRDILGGSFDLPGISFFLIQNLANLEDRAAIFSRPLGLQGLSTWLECLSES